MLTEQLINNNYILRTQQVTKSSVILSGSCGVRGTWIICIIITIPATLTWHIRLTVKWPQRPARGRKSLLKHASLTHTDTQLDSSQIYMQYRNTCIGLFLGQSPIFIHTNHLRASICMLLSSVKMTSSKVSPLCFFAQLRHFALFVSHISWQ